MGKYSTQLILTAAVLIGWLLWGVAPAGAQTSTPTPPPPTSTPWPTVPVPPQGDILDGLPAVPTPFDLDSLPAPVATLDLSEMWAGENIEMLFSTAPAVAQLPASLPGWDYFVYFIMLLAGVKLLMKMRSSGRGYEDTVKEGGASSAPQGRSKNSMKV